MIFRDNHSCVGRQNATIFVDVLSRANGGGVAHGPRHLAPRGKQRSLRCGHCTKRYIVTLTLMAFIIHKYM